MFHEDEIEDTEDNNIVDSNDDDSNTFNVNYSSIRDSLVRRHYSSNSGSGTRANEKSAFLMISGFGLVCLLILFSWTACSK